MNMTIALGVLIALNVAVLVISRLRKPATVTGDMTVAAAQAAINRNKQERFEVLSRFFRGRGAGNKIERNLVTAGLMLKPSEFLMVNLLTLCIIVLLGLWHISHMPGYDSFFGLLKRVLWLAFYLFVGWKSPQWILQFMANRRRTKLEYQLADALTIIASGLKGGYSFVQGLDMASQQLEAPIKDETARVLRLIQLGLDTPRALLQMAERVNSYDYEMTVSATNIQLSVGGNLAQMLESIAETIRDRIRLRRDIGVLTAQGRISGTILVALPVCIGLMLSLINPEYMGRLRNTELGNNLLYMAGGMQAMGIYWIKKLLDFDN